MSTYTMLHGDLSPLKIYTPQGEYDVSPLVVSFEITESIFSPFISGNVVVSDTESLRVIKNIGLKDDLSCMIGFSFSGLEDDGKTSQKAITLNPQDYWIYKIEVMTPRGVGTQETVIYFAHKVLFSNQTTNISRSYQKKKVTEMVRDIAKTVEVEWNQIENTANSHSFVFPYRTAFGHIMYLSSVAVREENSNDANFVFYQDLTGKHNFVSLGKLFSQQSTFGSSPNDGYLYTLNPAYSFASARRAVATHITKTLNAYQNALNGMHSSAVFTLDPNSKTWAATGFFLPEKWNKQSHISNTPMVPSESQFYNTVNGVVAQRYYEKSRHSHCCKEQKNGNDKVGGENDRLMPRISQMEQLDQTGIEFYVTGNSDISKVGAGKIIFFGRPILNDSVNSSDGMDVTFSGKYLVMTVTHFIRKVKSGKIEYGCSFKCCKDALGEE